MGVLFIVPAVALLLAAIFRFGYRRGGDRWQAELARVRMESLRAERQLHDLTRQAFISMVETAERHRQIH